MKKQYETIIDLFKKKKQLTDLELQGLLPFNPNSIRPARLKLLREGIIRNTSRKSNGYTIYELNPDYKPKRNKKPNILKVLRKNKKLLSDALELTKELIQKLS